MTPRTLILGTAGHIDHGKTAIVRALTGVDTDRLPQEKERGITIDIGFAELVLGDVQLGIVDVPGHERFIKNMLAGSTGIDLALLVVAADDSVMPQTREHLAILRLLGVRRGVVALSKLDLAEPGWTDLVEEEIRGLVRGTFLEGAPIVRTSTTSGEGFDDLRTALASAARAVEEPPEDDVFRLAIDRAFVQAGAGTIVTGTVHSGRLDTGDPVELMPAGRVVKVRGLQTHDRDAGSVTRGQRAAFNLMGVHHTQVRRGHELATPGFLRPATMLTVRLHLLADSPWPLKHRARVRLYVGTQEVMATVSLLESNVLERGGETYAQLALDGPAVATGGQPFVIRAQSPLVTLGGGQVLEPVARRIARRDEAKRRRLPDLSAPDPAVRAGATIASYGTRPWTEMDLARDAGILHRKAADLIRTLMSTGVLEELTVGRGRPLRLHHAVRRELEERVLDAMSRLHERSPLETMIPRTRVTAAVSHHGDEAVLGAIVDGLVAGGPAIGDERSVARADFRPSLTSAQRDLRERVTTAYREAGFSPPAPEDLARASSAPEGDVRAVVDLCVRAGELVHLGGRFFLHPEAEAGLRRRMCEVLRERAAGMTMSEIRTVLGTSRKYALPMCEYLDRIGVTRRVGDVRVLGEEARERPRGEAAKGRAG